MATQPPLSKRRNTKLSISITKNMDFKRDKLDPSLISQITSPIYIGSQDNANDYALITKLGITHIINCTHPLEHFPNKFEDRGISYLNVSIGDNPGEPISDYFDEAFDFIEDVIHSGHKVLVHCQMGISRSTTIVISYLMRKNKLSFKHASAIVTGIRPFASPNIGFISQLTEHELQLKNTHDSYEFYCVGGCGNLTNGSQYCCKTFCINDE